MFRLRVAAVTTLLMLGTALQAAPAAAVDNVEVTVTIMTYQEIDCPDNFLVPCPGDYYAAVAIGAHDFESTPKGPVDTATHSPYWRVTQTVDRDQGIGGNLPGFIPIRIELWDDDEDGINSDEMVDISDDGPDGQGPGNHDRTLDLVVDARRGDWDGESGRNGMWSQGGTLPRSRILFDVSISGNGDVDEDGIPDGVERFGIRRIADGGVVANLANFGTPTPQRADPCRKTILLEIDFMTGAADGHSHFPKDAAITEVSQAFANAPVGAVSPCPYTFDGFGSTGGVQLLIERGNTIPETAVFTLDDLVSTRNDAANFAPERRPYFHYAVFAHDQAAGKTSSGVCCRDGKDFIVTLGSWRTRCIGPGPDGTLETTAASDDVVVGATIQNGPNRTCNTAAAGTDRQTVAVGGGAADHAVGTVRDQSGTIMHELGHALGLEHRGRDDVNHSPNYLSNMNYHFQAGIPQAGVAGSTLDYSRNALPTLTEASLNENVGIGGPSTLLTTWFDPTGTLRTANAGGAIDWNQNATIEPVTPPPGAPPPPPVSVDLNNDSACVGPGPNGTLDTTVLGGDDAVANGVIGNGINDTCETTPAPDDVRITTGAAGTPINWICVGTAANEQLAAQSVRGGDDQRFSNKITAGPNQVCESTAGGGDIQVVPLGTSEPPFHPGWDDWSNLRYRAALSRSAAGQGAGHEHGELDYAYVLFTEARFRELMDPDLAARKVVDKADATPGETLRYTVTATNVGTGDATAVSVTDTLPDGTVQERVLPNLIPRQSREERFNYTVPCGTRDGTVLVNRATLSATDLQGGAEANTANNSGSASTTVHAPVMTLAKIATPSVNAGEAITYRLTYANTGSGDATNVVVTDTLPVDVYYSPALDTGAGPRPDSVTVNADGTRTLQWNLGTVAKHSEPFVLEFTARPTLLALGGTTYHNSASLTFSDANGCTYLPVTAAAPSAISVVAPTRDPLTIGFWRNHPERWTDETLARIQATDQRYDGADGSVPDSRLSAGEVTAVLAPASGASVVLRQQLLAVYLNLAERRINAGTAISSKLASSLQLHDVRSAAIFGIDTLALSAPSNRTRYANATDVLDEINNNKSPVY
jgi:uncharacterized repeat protein (TIGR01451 family)